MKNWPRQCSRNWIGRIQKVCWKTGKQIVKLLGVRIAQDMFRLMIKRLKSARYAARNWRIKMDDIILKITAEIVITQEDVDDIMSTALDSSTLQCW